MKPRIIYQDDAVIVAYKPSGLATQTARVGQPDMVSELKKELALNTLKAGIRSGAGQSGAGQSNAGQSNGRQTTYLGVIHRLDQPVEGLLVFAKTPKAATELSRQLAGGSLNKQYFAVVYPQADSGKPYVKEAELVDYMFKDKANCAQIVTEEMLAGQQACYPEAKKAVLRYKLKETTSVSLPKSAVVSGSAEQTLSATELALADIYIETGRFHQIRCQLAHNGMPLLGDAKYGDERTVGLSRELGIRSVALCAYKLGFQHPVTKQKMSFEIKPENKAFEFFLENNFGCDCLY